MAPGRDLDNLAFPAIPMHGDARAIRPDFVGLSELLGALAYPVRLELLNVLRHPHTLAEIRVGAHKPSRSGSAGRPAAKQTVAGHLAQLVGTGLVRTDEVRSAGRKVPAYHVSPQRLYALIEELRTLSVLQSAAPSDDLTATGGTTARPPSVKGAHFVLVHGVYEGKHYALEGAPDATATIGRSSNCTIRLDYDPYVSLVNSHVERTDKDLVLTDDPGSKNGTTLNWIPLAPDERQPLRSGDLVGVGRSRLLFLDR